MKAFTLIIVSILMLLFLVFLLHNKEQNSKISKYKYRIEYPYDNPFNNNYYVDSIEYSDPNIYMWKDGWMIKENKKNINIYFNKKYKPSYMKKEKKLIRPFNNSSEHDVFSSINIKDYG